MQTLHPIMAQALAPWAPKPLTPAQQQAQQWHKRNDAAALKQQQKDEQCTQS